MFAELFHFKSVLNIKVLAVIETNYTNMFVIVKIQKGLWEIVKECGGITVLVV